MSSIPKEGPEVWSNAFASYQGKELASVLSELPENHMQQIASTFDQAQLDDSHPTLWETTTSSAYLKLDEEKKEAVGWYVRRFLIKPGDISSMLLHARFLTKVEELGLTLDCKNLEPGSSLAALLETVFDTCASLTVLRLEPTVTDEYYAPNGLFDSVMDLIERHTHRDRLLRGFSFGFTLQQAQLDRLFNLKTLHTVGLVSFGQLPSEGFDLCHISYLEFHGNAKTLSALLERFQLPKAQPDVGSSIKRHRLSGLTATLTHRHHKTISKWENGTDGASTSLSERTVARSQGEADEFVRFLLGRAQELEEAQADVKAANKFFNHLLPLCENLSELHISYLGNHGNSNHSLQFEPQVCINDAKCTPNLRRLTVRPHPAQTEIIDCGELVLGNLSSLEHLEELSITLSTNKTDCAVGAISNKEEALTSSFRGFPNLEHLELPIYFDFVRMNQCLSKEKEESTEEGRVVPAQRVLLPKLRYLACAGVKWPMASEGLPARSPKQDADYVVIEHTKEQLSRQEPVDGFPEDVEISSYIDKDLIENLDDNRVELYARTIAERRARDDSTLPPRWIQAKRYFEQQMPNLRMLCRLNDKGNIDAYASLPWTCNLDKVLDTSTANGQ